MCWCAGAVLTNNTNPSILTASQMGAVVSYLVPAIFWYLICSYYGSLLLFLTVFLVLLPAFSLFGAFSRSPPPPRPAPPLHHHRHDDHQVCLTIVMGELLNETAPSPISASLFVLCAIGCVAVLRRQRAAAAASRGIHEHAKLRSIWVSYLSLFTYCCTLRRMYMT